MKNLINYREEIRQRYIEIDSEHPDYDKIERAMLKPISDIYKNNLKQLLHALIGVGVKEDELLKAVQHVIDAKRVNKAS